MEMSLENWLKRLKVLMCNDQKVTSYLKNRTQFVVYDGVKSYTKSIDCGVPSKSVVPRTSGLTDFSTGLYPRTPVFYCIYERHLSCFAVFIQYLKGIGIICKARKFLTKKALLRYNTFIFPYNLLCRNLGMCKKTQLASLYILPKKKGCQDYNFC